MAQPRQANINPVTLYRRIPHFTAYILLSFTLALAVQLISLVPPLIMQRIIDVLIPAGNIRDVTVSVLFFIAIPIAFFPSDYFGKIVNGLTGRIIQANGKMAQTITDSVRSIRLVKAYQLEKRQTNRLKGALTDAIAVWSKVAFFDNLTTLWITNFVNQLIIGVIFVVAASLVIQGQMTIGGIVIILSYLAVFYANASTVLNTNYQFKKQLAEFAPLAELLQLANPETSGDQPLTDFHEVGFDHVTFHYTEERGDILKDLSLTVKKGDWVGLVGQSGAGKTTIFDLLLRFYSPQQGVVRIDQTPLAQFDLTQLRRQITLVSQDISIFPGTLRENLQLAKADATDGELLDVLAAVELKDFIATLPAGLDTPVGEEGSLLSGGQKQRLSLAQGLLRHSPILLLDEISSALDAETSTAIKDMVYRLKTAEHLTILSISHDAQFLTRCDAVYRIQDGQAVPVAV